MEVEVYNYRYAVELLQHKFHAKGWKDLMEVCQACPQFIYPGKSKNYKRGEVVQQCLNTYFDIQLHERRHWELHPSATRIYDSNLATDYRKEFGAKPNDLHKGITVTVEVQFGNMARWYADIFKFQTAFSQGTASLGVSIVPMSEMAVRIDQNVTNFERIIRELPSAELSITLPILVIGLKPGPNTKTVNLKSTGLSIKEITAKGSANLRAEIVRKHVD